MSTTLRRWYLLQCKPREAFRALEHLGNQGFVAFLPTLAREVVRRGRSQTVTEPLFPHYLFVHLDDVSDNWAPIRSTRGVSRLVTFGSQPLAVPEEIVASLQAREAALAGGDGALVLQALFAPGQRLAITEGPLAGLEAVFAARDGDERVILLLNFLHQQQSVSVPIHQVRVADG